MIRSFIFMVVIYGFKYPKTCPRKGGLVLMALHEAKVGPRQRTVV